MTHTSSTVSWYVITCMFLSETDQLFCSYFSFKKNSRKGSKIGPLHKFITYVDVKIKNLNKLHI